ncbi:SIMPL domain-containing protein [Roseivirga sp.]|uniref:SIMPL domain-containing protein n=1 Tax=Roseivirga sp. TaxID=1964215 RepID=UPI003B521091
MKQIITSLILLSCLNFPLLAQESNTLRIEGKAEMEVVPEIMEYKLNLNISTTNQKRSLDSLNQIVNMVTRALIDVGLPADSILTEGFNVNTMNDRFNPENGIQYAASQNLSFKTSTRSEHILAVINALADLDIPYNLNNSPQLSKKQSEQVRLALIEAALDDAKEKAAQIARAGQFRLKGISSINYQEGYNLVVYEEAEFDDEIMVGAAKASRSFGDYHVAPEVFRKNVVVTFKIKSK